jgi:hypothetical protein
MKTQMTIGKKLNTALISIGIIFIFVAGYNYYNLSVLGKLQDDGATRANQIATVNRYISLGDILYSVIADAEINRNYSVTEIEWKKHTEICKNGIDEI